jgi:hypothetical protein
MIKNESLGTRLNEFKNKQSKPALQSDKIVQTLGAIYVGSLAVLRTIVYGYGFKIVFSTDWTFWSVICVGFGFDFLLSYIRDLIHPKSDNINL